jgi:hypothetical protein
MSIAVDIVLGTELQYFHNSILSITIVTRKVDYNPYFIDDEAKV